MFFPSAYLIVLPGVLLMFWAQSHIKGAYRRYAQVRSKLGMTGAQTARAILQKMNITGVTVEQVVGELTDHYDPRAKAVRLSQGIYDSDSLAAAAVAAHECGHVLQDYQGYAFMNFRATLVPAANIGSQLGPMLVIAGAFLSFTGLSTLGIILFSAVIAFHLITLPVEFDASRRALKLIDQLGILQGEENKGARAVLQAAAWTYVATAFYAVLQLIYFFLLSRDR